MKFNIWLFLFNFFDEFYFLTGFRLQTPIEWFFPNFCPWLFGKMIGVNGTKVGEKYER